MLDFVKCFFYTDWNYFIIFSFLAPLNEWLIFSNVELIFLVYYFTFNLSVQLYLKNITCRQHIVESCIFIWSDDLCLLIGRFRWFLFNVIIDVVNLNITFCFLFSIFIICFSFWYYFPLFGIWNNWITF